MRKDGTVETVEDMIECLKKCNPKARIETRPQSTRLSIVQEPGKDIAYVDVNTNVKY